MAPKNFATDIEDATIQAAVQRAQAEGKSVENVLAGLVLGYARTGSTGGFVVYTVQRGDTLAKIARQFYNDAHQYPFLQQVNQLDSPSQIWVGQNLVIPVMAGVTPVSGAPAATPALVTPPSTTPTPPTPPVPAPVPQPSTPAPAPTAIPQPSTPQVDPCAAISGESYGTLSVVGSPTDRPAAQHGDINLALRGYVPTTSNLGLIDMSGPTDHRAPQLAGLFADERTPTVSNVYRAHHWDWGRNARGSVISDFDVTVMGCQVEVGETVHVPSAGYSIGQGYAVLVLYADQERITLKYTGEDSVVGGYTIHVEGVCTEPNLLALYNQMNGSGRRNLPALRAGQAFGRAREIEVRVAIRDTGRFMDPRVRKDWWSGR
jgi:hypothetical protein